MMQNCFFGKKVPKKFSVELKTTKKINDRNFRELPTRWNIIYLGVVFILIFNSLVLSNKWRWLLNTTVIPQINKNWNKWQSHYCAQPSLFSSYDFDKPTLVGQSASSLSLLFLFFFLTFSPCWSHRFNVMLYALFDRLVLLPLPLTNALCSNHSICLKTVTYHVGISPRCHGSLTQL